MTPACRQRRDAHLLTLIAAHAANIPAPPLFDPVNIDLPEAQVEMDWVHDPPDDAPGSPLRLFPDTVNPAPRNDEPEVPQGPPPDDEAENPKGFEEKYPIDQEAGKIHATSKSYFESVREDQLRKGDGNVHFPFSGKIEWGLASWMHSSGMPLSKLDEFLKLDYVTNRPPSFRTGASLHRLMEQLPSGGAEWMCTDIKPDYGSTFEPVTMFYRDPLAVIQALLKRPPLHEYTEWAPRRLWSDATKTQRYYTDMSTGDWWWTTQASLPIGSTLLPVMLGSDKTHLTAFGGDKSAWPLYISLGNIKGRPRNSPTNRAWTLLAYLPIVKFSASNDKERKKTNTTHVNRFFHQCLRFILKPMVAAGTEGITMADSQGNQRLCFPRLAAYLADYPEQVLINVAASNVSPITTAGNKDLGSRQPLPPRTYQEIMQRIEEASLKADPNNVKTYHQAAKALGLNGVHIPFWKDLPGYAPELCLAPDILHGGIRFWRDHILSWALWLVDADELDRRLVSIQPVVGFKRFPSGIRHLSQWTGREDRELMRMLVALIAESRKVAQDPRAMRALQTLQYMANALDQFHANKQVFIDLGARRDGLIRAVLKRDH